MPSDVPAKPQGYSFHANLPTGCPPGEAEPVSGEIFRGIRETPISETDFLSHRETGSHCDAPECECWGLSVWASMEAVEHARKAIPPIRRFWYIASGDLGEADGVIKHTPNRRQPQHHTFWRDAERDFADKFKIIITPSNV
jgi:hypothetical protein